MGLEPITVIIVIIIVGTTGIAALPNDAGLFFHSSMEFIACTIFFILNWILIRWHILLG